MSKTIQSMGTSTASTNWQHQLEDAQKLGKPKSLFVRNERNVQAFATAKEHFKEAFQSEMHQVALGLPKGAVNAFMEKANTALNTILDLTFGHVNEHMKDGQYTKKAHREMIKEANFLAVGSFKEINNTLLRDENIISHTREQTHGNAPTNQDTRPQLFVTGEGLIKMRRPAPPLETLVFRGGGAKGIGNPSALTELEISGALTGVKHVVGTSAGALTALTLASGYDAPRFTKLIEENPMTGMSGKVPGFSKKYPMVKLTGAAGRSFNPLGYIIRKKGGGSGQHALAVADKATAGRVSEYLQNSWGKEPFTSKLVELTNKHGQQTMERILMLKQTPDFESDRSGKMVTFKDLAILSELDPQVFKELTLTGYDKSKGTTTYFDAKSYPDMPVAVAGRISMGIPVIFQTVKFDPQDGKGTRKWVDGGVGSNMPSEVVLGGKEGRELESTKAKTLLFTYSENGNWQEKLHGDGKFKGSPVSNFIKGLIAGNTGLNKVNMSDNGKIYEGGLNTFVVHHNDIGTMDLKASEVRVQMAQAQSTLMSLKQIENRQELDFTQDFESVQEAIQYLTPDEKQAVLDFGPPNPLDYSGGETNKAYKAESHMYELLLSEKESVQKPKSEDDDGGIVEEYSESNTIDLDRQVDEWNQSGKGVPQNLVNN